MNEIKYKNCGKYRGLTLWYIANNGNTYVMKIWKNFRGVSFMSYDKNDKKLTHTSHYIKVSSWDYNTAFVYLRNEFNLIKE